MNIVVEIEPDGERCGNCRFLAGAPYTAICLAFQATPARDTNVPLVEGMFVDNRTRLRLVGCLAAEGEMLMERP